MIFYKPSVLLSDLRTAEKGVEHLLYLSPIHNTLYTSQVTLTPLSPDNKSFRRQSDRIFQHLACFFPGLLALGVHTLSSHISTEMKHKQLMAAEGLAQGCYRMYIDEPSGLGPDVVKFNGPFEIARNPRKTISLLEYDKIYRWAPRYDEWVEQGQLGDAPGLQQIEKSNKSSWWRRFFMKGTELKDYDFISREYLLRPETVESFYILWRVTGDEKWRERGWDVFKAIDRNTKTLVKSNVKGADAFAYSSVNDVTKPRKRNSNELLKNEMPSYFYAET